MNRTIFRIKLLIVLTLAFSSCQVAEERSADPEVSVASAEPAITLSVPPTAIALMDGLDRQITLGEPAQKIVSLAASNTEILFALGAGNQVIGRDNFSDFPAQALDIPGVGDVMGFNEEMIVDLQPDLVLAAGITSPELVKALEDLGLTVYYLPNPEDMDGLYGNLITVGILTGHEQEARELIEELKKRAGKVDQVVAKTLGVPSVFYELDGTDPSKPWTTGPGTFIHLWITKAGGRNIGESLSGEWVQLSQEEIILQDPEIIVLGDSIYGVTPEMVAERAGWEGIRAVKEGKVFPFDDNLISRPGPRLVDGLVEMTRMIHPEIADEME